ncbi:hypothetical protein MAE02_57860 [Microvirga aerophila]|uniref:Uncharacterized protein n=1 Tax=Microvirga aerophila TaxID=670291 RepID=A0A512C1L7_9HYPH|nr:hypothetical protein MAE02_57860 [Microvirga aerophila]
MKSTASAIQGVIGKGDLRLGRMGPPKFINRARASYESHNDSQWDIAGYLLLEPKQVQ